MPNLSCTVANFILKAVIVKVMDTRFSIAILRLEAEIYDKLEALQGEYIPKCYGLFEGEFKNGYCACLVLSDCGEPLKPPLNKVNFATLYVAHDHPYMIVTNFEFRKL